MRHAFLMIPLVTGLWAQTAAPLPRRAHKRTPPPPIQDGPLATRLFQIRMTRIQQTMGLPEYQARAMAERWRQYDCDFMNTARRSDPLKNQMEEILRGTAPEDEKNRRIKPLLDAYLPLWNQLGQSRRRFEEDLRANLSPAQQARLILLMDQLHRELEQILRDTVREHHKGTK
jgi:hypothetical protein